MHRILFLTALALGVLLLFIAAAPVPGGAPYITITGKSSGTFNRTEWSAVTVVELKGCVAGATIAKCTVRFTDAKGKPVTATAEGAKLTTEQRGLVAKVHNGTRFTVSVEAYDGKRKLDVREAVFTMVE
jgi:ribosomal protein S3AE